MPDRSLDQLARGITSAAVRMAAATAAWLGLVAEFDEREGWAGYGVRSCAHWLAWQCGMGQGTAREHVRVARALLRLPSIRAAFEGGRLSFSKVRALTRVADPHTEADLLELALRTTASQTERTVRQWRRADDLDEESVAARQQFDWWWDDDGMLRLTIRMNRDEGAALLAAVESLAERAARRDRAEAGRRAQRDAAPRRPVDGRAGEPPVGPDDDDVDELSLARERSTARRLAALASLADVAANAGRRPGDPPRREVVLHVDAAVLEDDAAAGRAYLEGGPALHPSQARRMLCEATVVTMLERDREVLAVGRRRRRATRAQRLALLRRDGGCARPGCTEHRIERLHAHHMRHWLHGGRTDLANLVLLCDVDHGLAHDLDLVMSRRDGRVVALAPDGRRVWGPPDTAFAAGVAHEAAPPDERFAGVHPIDALRGRRPSPAGHTAPPVAGATQAAPPGPAAPATATPTTPTPPPGSVSRLLFPDGEPRLPEEMPANGERMDLRYVVSVPMGNRDLTRRLAAEAGAGPAAA